MKKLLPYFKNYKKESVLGPLFKLLEATFELLVPVLVGLIVDEGIAGGDRRAVWGYCAVLVAFGLIGLLCAVVAQYFAAKAATGVSSAIRVSLFDKLQSLSYADLDRLGTSTILTRMTGDVNQFQSGVNLFLRLFLRSPFIVFGAMIAAFFIDVRSATVFAVAIPVLAAVVFGIMLITMPLYKKSQSNLDGVLLSTRENLSGARVIRAFCMEQDEQQLFNARNAALTKSRSFADGVSALMNPLTYALINVAIVWLIHTGALQVNAGRLGQGEVIALYNLMTQILVELIKLANLIVSVTKAVACGNRIEKVLQMQPSLQFEKEGQTETQTENQDAFVCFDGASVRYNAGADCALEDVSFCVGQGQRVGIIGGTGSGKTTLVNLIARFYDVEKGGVFVGGKNVKAWDGEKLREMIAIVPQKAELFKGTVRENLLWGKADATDEELWSALKTAQADGVVQEKGGLDAIVERGGKNFSGGQRQRLTIARALVKKPQILILDDSSSALDYATDAALRKALKELQPCPTVFVVSQRTSALGGADQIVVLDDGKMVGLGTHETLLSSCETYREIYLSQYEGGETA